jgi:hypothetical protein
MKPLTEYVLTDPWPEKHDFTTTYVYSRGQLRFSGTQVEYRARQVEFVGCVVEHVVEEAKLIVARADFSLKKKALYLQFKDDLIEEAGMQGDHRANALFKWCSDREDGDLNSISDMFIELADIMMASPPRT